MTRKTFALGVSGIALIAALASSPTAAQTKPKVEVKDVEEVVVTGTSIRGIASPGAPTVAVGREEIIATGLASASEVAKVLPQVFSIGADESRRVGAQQAGSNRTAATGINLRGLGNEATLLLIDGRRTSPGGSIRSITDPNIIPNAAIARIEVVLDGASAIYGADAVAGVINVITRRAFDGAESTIKYGAADGMHQWIYSQSFGTTWSTGEAFIAYESNERSNLLASARSRFTSADRRSRGGSDARSLQNYPGTIVVSGVNYAIPATSTGTVTAAQLVPNTQNYFDTGTFGDLLPEQTRRSTFLEIRQDLTEKLRVYFEGFYSTRDFNELVTPVAANITVPRTNPFFVHPTNPAAASVVVNYRFLEGDGDAYWRGYDNGQQATVGFEYDLTKDWQATGYFAHSINRARSNTHDTLNNSNLALLAASTDRTIAFNPFTASFNNNPATIKRIVANREVLNSVFGKDYVLKADGPLFDMPGGTVRLAVGGQYTDTLLKYKILSAVKNAASDLLIDRVVDKGRTAKAVFAEVFVPLVGKGNAMPLIQRLELSAAVRTEEFSDFGKTTNPKFGLTWEPIDDLSFRATYGTSFRAPSILDASDAVSNIFVANIPDPQSPTGTTRGIFFNGGQPGLKPEEATTWSVGSDWQPSFVPGLSLTLTYYNVDYRERIDALTQTQITSNPTRYSNLIVRNPSVAVVAEIMSRQNFESAQENPAGIFLIVDTRRTNLGRLKQNGFDFSAAYDFSTPIGDWRATWQLTKILKQEQAPQPGQPFVEVQDTFGFPVSLRMRGSLTWRRGGWAVNGFVNYVGAYVNNAVIPSVDVDTLTTFDGGVSYTFSDRDDLLNGIRIALTAQNLADKEPPIVLNGTASWDSENASAIGRFVALEISKKW